MKYIFLIILSISNLLSASFNCDKASLPHEITICESDKLSDLDSELALYYFSIKNQLEKSNANNLLNAQKKWITKRNTICKYNNEPCLIKLYQDRIDNLKNKFLSRFKNSFNQKQFCKKIKLDYEEAIINCGLDQECISLQLSKSSNGLKVYDKREEGFIPVGAYSVKTQSAISTGTGLSLIQLELGHGWRFPNSYESWYVSSNKLQEFRKNIKSTNTRKKIILRDKNPFEKSLK